MGERDDDAPDALDAVVIAARKVGGDFFDAYKMANSGDPQQAIRGLLLMQVLNTRDGEFPTRKGFERLPVHLPDDEDGMRRLFLSQVPADAEMKADFVRWANGNREYRDRAAKALEVAASSWHQADAILADEECEDAELGEWATELADYLAKEWRINIRMSPPDKGDLEQWCAEVVGRLDITPRWATGEEKLNVFTPDKHKTKPRRDPMRPFKANVDD